MPTRWARNKATRSGGFTPALCVHGGVQRTIGGGKSGALWARTWYFELMDGPDKTRVADVFTGDATVLDDGHTYRGRAEIAG